ncbi:MAG: hypothetical protein Q8N03_10505 [Ignavibacteria bacterium]|nr:hypothetical protein [Ignavibacteria bacterium]MDP3829963.1 hypothetical protein [Ignavibacteriaceae bacterium]
MIKNYFQRLTIVNVVNDVTTTAKKFIEPDSISCSFFVTMRKVIKSID